MHRTLPLGLSLIALVACEKPRDRQLDPPPPPKPIQTASALTAANQNLRNVMVGAANTGEFSKDISILGGFVSDGAPIECPPPPDPCEAPPERTLEDDATEMADMVAEKILNIANVKIEEPTRIVLEIVPGHACLDDGATQPNADCVNALTAHPVSIELSQLREGNIDLVLNIGTWNIGKLELYPTQLAAELDIGALLDAARALSAAANEPIDGFQGDIRGRFRAELKQHGPQDYEGSFSILSALDVDLTIDGETFTFDVGPSTPLIGVRLDGNAQRITTQTNTGPINMKLPLAIMGGGDVICEPNGPCEEPAPLTGTLELDIGATSNMVSFDTSDTVEFSYSINGGVDVRFNGLPLLSYDLNQNNGGAFDGKVENTENGTLVSVSPLVDARAQFTFENLGAQAADLQVPDMLLNDTMTLRLDGAPEPSVMFSNSSDQIRVMAGALMLGSSAAGRQINVGAGMCLGAIEQGPEDPEPAHPFDALESQVCQ